MTDVRPGMRVPIMGGPRDGETVFVLAETPDSPPQIYRQPVPGPHSIDVIDYRLSRYFDGPSLTESWVYIHPDHRFYGSYGVVAESAETWSQDQARPDTSQPYPLDDLIGRIDELT